MPDSSNRLNIYQSQIDIYKINANESSNSGSRNHIRGGRETQK